MDAMERGKYRCVACERVVSLTTDRRCVHCGVSYASEAARMVSNADATLARLRAQAAEVESRAEEWRAYRTAAVQRLMATAPVGWVSRLASVETADATGVPSSHAPVAQVAPETSPLREPAQASASTASQPRRNHVPEEQRQAGRAAEVARRALTAPALLGIAGASLLIAASIVFVALAWTAFSPLARGMIVSLVAFLVSGIALWLKRMNLSISSGAVGIVAMGFAATASLAFSRGGDAVGAYETPTALLIACGAGLLLSRLGIPWVGSAAGLAFAGAAIGFTVAATSNVTAADGPGDPGVLRGVWVWTAVGSLAALALAATHRLWKFAVAKVAVQWASVLWLGVVGLGASVWIWANDAIPLDAVIALVPVVMLAILARRWTVLASGPAAFLFTLVVAAGAATLGASAWQQAAAVAVAVALLLALGPRLPDASRLPMLVALSPAYLVVAVASAVYSIGITIARILAGTYVPDTEMWAGVAALVAGLSVAQLRSWRLESAAVRLASVLGAAMVVTGSGIVAFGVAEAVGDWYHTSVALAMAIAAAGLMVAVRAWTDPRARWLSANSAVAFALVAAFHAGWGIVASETHLVLGLTVFGAALAVLAWRALQSPWWGALPASLVLSCAAPVIAARYGLADSWVLATGIATVGALLWGGRRIPQKFHRPVLVGTVPALVASVVAATAAAVDLVARTVGGVGPWLDPAWLVVAALGSAALAAIRRWHVPAPVADAASIAGASSLIAVAGGAALAAARAFMPDAPGAVALWAIPACVALAASGWAWQSRAAAWTSGLGATTMLTVAGAHGALTLAHTKGPLWLPTVVCVAVAGLLAGFSAWWPRVTLGPCALVITLSSAAVAWRSGEPQVSLLAGVGAAAVTAGLVVWLRRDAGRFAAWGSLPALVAGLVMGAAAALVAVVDVVSMGYLGDERVATWTMALALIITGVLALILSATPPHAALAAPLRWVFALTVAAGIVVATAAAGNTAVHVTASPAADVGARTLAMAAISIVACVAFLFLARRQPFRRVVDDAMRTFLDVFAVVWLTIVALATLIALVPADRPWIAPAVSVLAIAAALLLGARWRASLVAAPLALLATALPFALLLTRMDYHRAALASTLVVCATAWLIRWKGQELWARVLVGQSPFIAMAAFGVLQLAMVTLAALTQGGLVALDGSYATVAPWTHLTAVALAGAVLAVPRAREHVGTVTLVTLALVVSLFVPIAAAGILAGASLAAAILGKRARTHDAVAAAVAVFAVLWASSSLWAMAAVLAVVSAIGVLAALRQRADRVKWGVVVASVAAAASAGVAVAAMGGDSRIAWPTAMAVLAVAAITLALRGLDLDGRIAPWSIGAATVLMPVFARDATSAGLTLAVASVAWLGMTAMGRDFAKWWCASALSLGVALLVADAGIEVIEAYTLVPAAAALLLGVLWMRRAPEVRSLVALWPGLSLALVPSYVALALDPDSLPRTVALTLAIVVLALLAVRLRWFALVVATATTALVVSALQIIVGSNMVLRLVSFAIVGSLLLAVASWFERIKTLR